MTTRLFTAMIAGAVAFAFVGAAQSALLIDDFNTAQIVTDDDAAGSTSTTAVDFTATDLPGADRTITNTVTPGGTPGGVIETEVVPLGPPANGVLSISANALSDGGSSELLYNDFAGVDFAAAGTAIILDVLSIDLGVTVEMIVNGSSTSGPVAFAGPGVFFVPFAAFSDPTQFTSVDEVRLTFSGDNPWDGTFQFLRTDDPRQLVPAPASLLLLGLGLAGLGWARRKA